MQISTFIINSPSLLPIHSIYYPNFKFYFYHYLSLFSHFIIIIIINPFLIINLTFLERIPSLSLSYHLIYYHYYLLIFISHYLSSLNHFSNPPFLYLISLNPSIFINYYHFTLIIDYLLLIMPIMLTIHLSIIIIINSNLLIVSLFITNLISIIIIFTFFYSIHLKSLIIFNLYDIILIPIIQSLYL